MKKGLLQAYRLAFGFTSMKDKQEILKAMEEIGSEGKQLILDDMENWQLEENPLGINTNRITKGDEQPLGWDEVKASLGL